MHDNKQMFEREGLVVTGTSEEINKYADDDKAFDVIKHSLESISKSVEKNEPKNEHTFIHQANIDNGKHLVIIGNVDKDGNISELPAT